MNDDGNLKGGEDINAIMVAAGTLYAAGIDTVSFRALFDNARP